MTNLEAGAKASYEAAMKGYAEMKPLPVDLDVLETPWEHLEPKFQAHWTKIVQAALDAVGGHNGSMR